MKCIICQREDIRKTDVKEEIMVGKEIVYLPINIPVCTTCGERYYDRRTIQYIEKEEQRLKEGKDMISRIEQKWEGYVGFFRRGRKAKAEEKTDTKMEVDMMSRLEQQWEKCMGFFRKGNKPKVELKAKVETEAKAEMEAKLKTEPELKAKVETVETVTDTEEKAKAFNWQLTTSDWVRAEAKVKAEKEAEAKAKTAAKAKSVKEADMKKAVDMISRLIQNNEKPGIFQKNVEGIFSKSAR